jgi:hypothetical protein
VIVRSETTVNKEDELEVQQILELQQQIEQRLIQLGFVGDDDAMGNIIHHLAELSVWGKKLSQEALPTFLNLPLSKKEELGELVVSMNYELTEMKEAIEDMEPTFIMLMNFLKPK